MLSFVADFTSGSLDTLKMEGQVEQTALWDIVFQYAHRLMLRIRHILTKAAGHPFHAYKKRHNVCIILY